MTVAVGRAQGASSAGPAVAYVRVSTEEQSQHGVSLAAQKERLQAYCTAAGLELVELVVEQGVSGGVPLGERPAGSGLLRHVLDGGARHVVALKLDRLFRNTEDALRQTRLWDRQGVALHLVDMGGQSLNTGSAVGRMMLTMTAGFAEFERNLISERTAAALQHKRSKGQVFNHTPYGWDREGRALVENAAEQEAIRLMQERREDCWSYSQIAQALNEDRVATKRGGRWHACTVRGVLAVRLRPARGCS